MCHWGPIWPHSCPSGGCWDPWPGDTEMGVPGKQGQLGWGAAGTLQPYNCFCPAWVALTTSASPFFLAFLSLPDPSSHEQPSSPNQGEHTLRGGVVLPWYRAVPLCLQGHWQALGWENALESGRYPTVTPWRAQVTIKQQTWKCHHISRAR